MAKLVIYEELEGEETIFEDFELSSQRILIGSSEDNNLVLDMQDIDPTHASLEFRNDHWVIQDLGGPGGTFVNGNYVDGPYLLQHNDLIELQTIKMRFFDDEVVIIEDEPETIPVEIGEEFKQEVHVSGRVWFGTIAGMTIAIIFLIILLFIVLDFLNILKLVDLLPLGLGQ